MVWDSSDWCTFAEAGLGVETVNSPSHLVNTFVMRINVHYFAGVKGLLDKKQLKLGVKIGQKRTLTFMPTPSLAPLSA